ncbi:MAG: sensor histidine kinase [Terriglobales bacterium]|jgi:signal transduction histidine kinase|nr:histidine kinase [Terriglobales bacterium]
MSAGEVRRIERWLATARLFLATAALVTIRMDPEQIRYSLWAHGLLAFYLAQSVVIILLLRGRKQSTPAFRLLVHSGDVIWPVLISIFATAQGNPFFLFFVFVTAAAAYRWGLWETVGTATASVILLWIESGIFYTGLTSHLDLFFLQHHIPLLRLDITQFEPKRLFMRSISLLVMGFLLGYLAEQQKQLRAEKAVIARVLARTRVEVGLRATLQDIMGEMLAMYGANSAIIASQENNSHHLFLGELRLNGADPSEFRWLEAGLSAREMYLYEDHETTAFFAARNSGGNEQFSILGLNKNGERIPHISASFLDRLETHHKFKSLISVPFLFGREWSGRIFLFDPALTGDTEEELRFLQELVRQVGPAVYNVYLLSRLRTRAGALERARFARELHDGAVQSLIAVEMQVDVLRRQSTTNSGIVTPELGRIQGLLREEVLKLRELMQQMKSLDVDSRRLLSFIGDTVERFQRETGITARFLTSVEDLKMPQPVCREIARIVQEALVNVRKHSKARQVLVRLNSAGERWQLIIEDDGAGFSFAGRLTHAELDTQGKGPVVIRERVRLIEGELTLESTPGQGSRLEVSIPQQREAAYG